MATIKERIEGGIYGLLVGDALGVPYEFHAQNEIPPVF
jgi:ADP-ribosyl-[dinitrogen reductase] hydrolase